MIELFKRFDDQFYQKGGESVVNEERKVIIEQTKVLMTIPV